MNQQKKERPILFSAPMVRALLDGSKTQTRRICKPQPLRIDGKIGIPYGDPPAWALRDGAQNGSKMMTCPYGVVGGRLWVRETWRIGAWREDDGEIAVDYMADNHSRREWLQVPEADDFEKYWLQCCDDCNKAGVKTDEDGKYHWEPGQSPCRVRPSIFMPRWASRILLEITGIRVERLQDISESDAMAEGCFALGDCECTAKRQYGELWESINGPGSWDANPWVWIIEFKKMEEI